MFANTLRNGNNVMMRRMKICKYFLAVLAVILSFQSIILIINFGSFLWSSPEHFLADQTGNSIKIQALWGYFQFSSQALPINEGLKVSTKVFGASVTLITFLSEKVPLFLVLWKIKQILQAMALSPFLDEICRKIKEIGWIIIYFGLLQKFVFQLCVSLICYHKFWFNNPFNLALLFAGGIVLLIGDIFAYGCELQKETDELL